MSSQQLPPPPAGPAPQSHLSEIPRGDPHADRRLRVFISSTLQELAPKRLVVREALLHLRPAPVMFELGARPIPRGTSTTPTRPRVPSSPSCERTATGAALRWRYLISPW